MRRGIHIAATALSIGLTSTQGVRANDGVKDCIQKITILENIFDAEKIKFRNDKCALLKAAKATRGAMLDEIAKRQDQCDLTKNVVEMLKDQQLGFEDQAALVCH